jgi:hypothetical protein
MAGISVNTRLICIASIFLAAASAQTHGWTSPVVLSTGGQGWEATAAIDGGGNSVALWDERTTMDQLWSRAKPSAGTWGSVTEVSPALQTTSVLPVVRVTTTGFATAVWSDQGGVWTADRPPASNWNPAQLLIPGVSNPAFVMDSLGDAAIVWSVGGARSSSSSVMAVLRPAGKNWTAQQLVASGVHLTADHVGIGDNGTVIVTWESYNAVCTKYGCSLSAYVLHASRQNTGIGMWMDSGSLMGPDNTAHDARVALDSAGGAILVALSKSGAYVSATQGNSGGGWSSFGTAFNPSGITMISNLLSDDAGHVTLAYEAIGFSSSQALVINGSINNNTWSVPVVLSGSDSGVSQIYLAVAPGGAALAVWVTIGSSPQIHAVRRATATGTWSSPVAISGPGSQIGPEAAAVNSAGDAIVIYSGYDASSVHTEYAISYQP